MAGRDVIRDHLSLSGGLTVLVAVLLLAPVIAPVIGVAWAFPMVSGILLGVGLAAIVYRRGRPSASGVDPEGEGRTLITYPAELVGVVATWINDLNRLY